ncbi:MAG: IS6 family transposase [Candidatus Thermoplasmatota archaeon]
MLDRLIKWVRENKIFVRDRKSNETRALAVLLYYLGLSYRTASQVLDSFQPASHEAIRIWSHKMEKLFVELQPKDRKAIALDETKVKHKGKWVYLWAAIDIERWEVLAAWITETRSCFDALVFLRKILKHCKNNPYFYVDNGPWYRWALKRLGLSWEYKTFGPRNPIEQWFSIFKHRIKRFYKRFPFNTRRETALSWCISFVALYNFFRGC